MCIEVDRHIKRPTHLQFFLQRRASCSKKQSLYSNYCKDFTDFTKYMKKICCYMVCMWQIFQRTTSVFEKHYKKLVRYSSIYHYFHISLKNRKGCQIQIYYFFISKRLKSKQFFVYNESTYWWYQFDGFWIWILFSAKMQMWVIQRS